MLEYVPLFDSPFVVRLFRSVRNNFEHFIFLCLRKKWIIILVGLITMGIAFALTRDSKSSIRRTVNYNLSFVQDSGQHEAAELREWTIHVREMINHLAPTDRPRKGQPNVDQSTYGYAYSFQILFSSVSRRALDSFSTQQLVLIETKARTMLPSTIRLNKLSETLSPPISKRLLIVFLAGIVGIFETILVIVFLDLMGFSYRGLKKTKERFLCFIPKYQSEKIESLTTLMQSLDTEMTEQQKFYIMFVGGDSSMDFVEIMGSMYATVTKAVVINFDLYKFNTDNEGLTDYLNGKCEMDDIFMKTSEGMYVIKTGSSPEINPYLLIMKEWAKVKALMERLNEFSVVLIRTPYIERFPIALKLLELKPLTVMVADANISNRHFMQLHKQLKQNQANIAGFVIDKVSTADISPNFWDQ